MAIRNLQQTCLILFIVMLMVGSSHFTAFAMQKITIEGRISSQQKIEYTGDKTYSIGISTKGAELAKHVGKRVRVTGYLIEIEDNPTILVLDFTVDHKQAE